VASLLECGVEITIIIVVFVDGKGWIYFLIEVQGLSNNICNGGMVFLFQLAAGSSVRLEKQLLFILMNV